MSAPLHRDSRVISSSAAEPPSLALVHYKHGDPLDVLTLEADMVPPPLRPPSPGMVQVRILCAAVNPADVNMVQGRYPILHPPPAVPGSDCVAEVTALHPRDEHCNLSVGDWVVPSAAGTGGSWRQRLETPCGAWVKLPPGLDLRSAISALGVAG